MTRLIKFLKDNVLYLVTCFLMVGAIAFTVVSLFVTVFHVDYFGLKELSNTIIRSDDIGFMYTFENLGNWFANGTAVEYHMFIQYCFIILCILGLALVCSIISFILGIFKEKFSKKIEFVGGAFGITAAICGFVVVFLAILSFTVNKLKSNNNFSFSGSQAYANAGLYLIIVAGVIFIFTGALLTALSSEKNVE